jgi:hypothetical protein
MQPQEKLFGDAFRVSTVAATLQEIDTAYRNKDVYVRYQVHVGVFLTPGLVLQEDCLR